MTRDGLNNENARDKHSLSVSILILYQTSHNVPEKCAVQSLWLALVDHIKLSSVPTCRHRLNSQFKSSQSSIVHRLCTTVTLCLPTDRLSTLFAFRFSDFFPATLGLRRLSRHPRQLCLSTYLASSLFIDTSIPDALFCSLHPGLHPLFPASKRQSSGSILLRQQ